MRKADGIRIDPLFVGCTRPATLWGVTYSAVIVTMILVMETFIMTKNLLYLLLFFPIHGICYLICLRDIRTFDLLFLWGKTKGAAWLRNRRFWQASSYSPLALQIEGNRYYGKSQRRRMS